MLKKITNENFPIEKSTIFVRSSRSVSLTGMLLLTLTLSACSTQQVARNSIAAAKLPAKAASAAGKAAGGAAGGVIGGAVAGKIGHRVGTAVGRTAGGLATGGQ